jgi:hypothetical protein
VVTEGVLKVVPGKPVQIAAAGAEAGAGAARPAQAAKPAEPAKP